MKILILLLLALPAMAQISAYGTLGTVQSNYWENPQLSFGTGASYTHNRLSVGVEGWRAEVNRHRAPWLNNDRRTEASLGLVSYRVWRGIHAEGGAGVQRITDTVYGPLVEGTFYYQKAVTSVGAYYQVGSRVFSRVGYRRVMLRNDHDTDQIYMAVGVSF